MEAHELDQRLSHYKSHMKIPSTGLLKAPPPSHRQQPPLPPLLPLPVSHLRRSFSSLGPSRTPASRNGNGTGHHSFNSKKSTKSSRKEEKKTPKRFSDVVTVSSTGNLGSKELSKDAVKISRFASMGNNDINSVIGSSGPIKSVEDLAAESEVFTVSPPPSSLPLPTFRLRRKLSCIAVTAGADTGATDNLRQLLRLQ